MRRTPRPVRPLEEPGPPMPMRPWTCHEVRYLERHAGDGAMQVAKDLGRTVESVKGQAKRLGISLRYRKQCPHCGQLTGRKLNPRTGWCACCTKEARAKEIARDVASLEDEVKRDAKANRERNRLYNRRYNAKKRLNGDTKSDTRNDQGK